MMSSWRSSLRQCHESRYRPTSCFFPPHPEFPVTGLKVPSVVRCDKLATVHRHILLGELGTLSPSLLGALDDCLRYALALQR